LTPQTRAVGGCRNFPPCPTSKRLTTWAIRGCYCSRCSYHRDRQKHNVAGRPGNNRVIPHGHRPQGNTFPPHQWLKIGIIEMLPPLK